MIPLDGPKGKTAFGRQGKRLNAGWDEDYLLKALLEYDAIALPGAVPIADAGAVRYTRCAFEFFLFRPADPF